MNKSVDFNELNKKYNNIHFIGIGGIGMSAIAQVLGDIGCNFQGSDLSENANVLKLKNKGIKIFTGHHADNVADASLVVRSSAITDNNVEVLEAKRLGIPVIRRADMLAEIMSFKRGISVSGSHGKTSTTAMIASLVENTGMDPTVINGGIINQYGSNSKLGKGEFIIVESDESDGSFVNLPTEIGVITNIEAEHLDYYGNFDELQKYFLRYVEQIPSDGLCALCLDDFQTRELFLELKNKSNIVTYALNSEYNPDISAFDIQQDRKGLRFNAKFNKEGKILKDIYLPIHGIHHAQNALAAIAVAKHLGISDENILEGMIKCTGVKRRFTKTGEVDGISIIDDYAHHPTEIKATLRTAKSILDTDKGEKLIVVFQPHRYTRVQNLFYEFCTCFDEADVLIVADIYAAGQNPIPGVTQDALIKCMLENGQKRVIKLDSPGELSDVVNICADNGDMVVCLGAGSISLWAHALPNELQILRKIKE